MRMPTIREEGLDVMTYLVYYFSGARGARLAARRGQPPTAPISYRPPVVRQLLVVVVVLYT